MFETILFKPGQKEFVGQRMMTVEQLIKEPTTEEIEMAIETLKNGKVPLKDNIKSELLKNNGKAVTKKLEQIVKKARR